MATTRFSPGQSISMVRTSGTAGVGSNNQWYTHLATSYDPMPVIINAVFWSGSGTLRLRDGNNVIFYTRTGSNVSSLPLPVLASTGGTELTVVTPITYQIAGPWKGNLILYGRVAGSN